MTYKDIQLDILGDEKEVAVVRLTRGAKRNALSDALILGLRNLYFLLRGAIASWDDLVRIVAARV